MSFRKAQAVLLLVLPPVLAACRPAVSPGGVDTAAAPSPAPPSAGTLEPAPAPPPPPPQIPTAAAPETPPPSLRNKLVPPAPAPSDSGLSREVFARVREGMSYDEVAGILAGQGERLSSGAAKSAIYQWTDAQGSSFMAKFEDGALVRKSLLENPSGSVAAAPDTSPLLSENIYGQIQPGMTFEEVRALVPVPADVISDNHVDVAVYMWTDSSGARFFAKFEDGKLARKSVVTVRPLAPSTPEAEAPEAAPRDETPPTETAPAGQEVAANAPPPAPATGAPAGEAPSAGVPKESAAVEPEALEEPASPSTPEEISPSRVRVTGAARRERQAQVVSTGTPPAGSFKPKADVPEHPFSLRSGVYEVRINNPSTSAVKVGLGAGKRGKEVTIPPGGARSVFVGQGAYALHFVYRDAPYTLYQGGEIAVDGQFQTDTEVTLSPDGPDIGPLNVTLE
ncbi:MAG: hypothetical protein HYV26_01855 [Candidatus Hydrogenedentes bacterium]|nr:hypothetical protein [Candidatus Hydrogenedentota bacterium]